MPYPKCGIDVNFCRNPQYNLFAEPHDPIKRPGRPKGNVKRNYPRGEVIGSKNEKTFKFGACGHSSIIKNNSAIVEEYRRLRHCFKEEGASDCCPSQTCENHDKPLARISAFTANQA
jgi:hypothetical protein